MSFPQPVILPIHCRINSATRHGPTRLVPERTSPKTPGRMPSTQLVTTSPRDGGEIPRAFWGWHGATAISGACHFAVMLAPTRRTIVSPTSPSGAGLIQKYMEAVGWAPHSTKLDVTYFSFWSGSDLRSCGFGKRDGRLHERQGPLRACRPDAVVPPFMLDERVFPRLLSSCHRLFCRSCSLTHRQIGRTFSIAHARNRILQLWPRTRLVTPLGYPFSC